MNPITSLISRAAAARPSIAAGLLALAALAPVALHAHGTHAGDLRLEHPYAVPSLQGSANGAAYLRSIRNTGSQPDRLIGASTPVAERVELHQMTLDAGVMRMRAVPAIELPAGAEVPLRHGGTYHLMLLNLKRPLVDGDRFELTLNFERAGHQTVKVWVQTPRDAAADHTH